MKWLLVLTSIVAAIGTAAPAFPDSNDDQFLAELRAAGITYRDPDRAIVAAKSVCQLAGQRMTTTQIVTELQNRNPAFRGTGAAAFTALAAAAYCPKYLTGERRAPAPSGGG
ncbi:DUF732 domain-containing protein [Mycobacterium shinjukuense]|uniref:DUF732 domain-containing protein n=1 Tax=Mycobacterium shinjukuense TaxID=398694 RepID=A0A7I7MQP4_9MYCO|nr:DUF732 domain-containing protein [Mycobacterium shinjukuense]MCV6984164.1 DUF732 domain-containing protein [Mycobacterium shinjukuense]ORB70256.1 hypothetical protein BST45_07020 [Mycobacterium shinjukuense]BBX74117.1 hypothetical protein MSHI_20230 [Mycobacterium shinjukuense]